MSTPSLPNDLDPPDRTSDVQQWEVEQKFHLTDSARLQAALSELQFVQTGIESHHDTYLQHPARDFRRSDEAFCVRRIDGKACVTYKGPRLTSSTATENAAKTREEIELDIDANQLDDWLRMLSRLGFLPQPNVIKRRTVYRSSLPLWQAFVVAVDDVEQLGSFAEVELLISDREQLDQAQRSIADLAHRLGLTHIQPHSYLSLLIT